MQKPQKIKKKNKNTRVHMWYNENRKGCRANKSAPFCHIYMYYTWSAETTPVNLEHPLLKHPEWFMVSIDGNSMAEGPINEIQNNSTEGRYLSPGLESVKRYLSRVITEVMVTYNIDGVHLDYIRYPGRNYDFHPIVRQQFSECYGVDPIQVVEGDTDIDPTLMYLGKWVEFKTEMIDKQVRSIRRRIDLVDRKIRLSAAVKPHADEAYYHYGQNWAEWLNEGIVDFVVTMSYFEEVEEFFDVMRASLIKVDGRKVIGGIGAYKVIPEKAAEQISLIRRWGLMGFCFFSYTVFLENPQYVEILEENVTVNDEGLPSDFRPYIRKYHE